MKRFLKIAGLSFGGLLVLLVGLFFVVTSDAFIRRVVLPRAGAAVGLPMRAETVSFSFSRHLRIDGLEIGDSDDFRLLAGTILVRYQLWPLLRRGDLIVDQILVDRLDGEIRQLPTPPERDKRRKPRRQRRPDETPSRVQIADVRIEHVNVLFAPSGRPHERFEVGGLMLRIPQLVNGQPFEASLAMAAKVVQGAADVAADRIELRLTGAFDEWMLPSRLQATLTVAGLAGRAGLVDLAGREMRLDLNTHYANGRFVIDQLRAVETHGEIVEASLDLSARLAIEPPEIALDLAVDLPSPALLNLLGGFIGDVDFGRTTANWTAKIDGTAGNGAVDFATSLTVSQASLASATLNLLAGPPLDVAASARGTVDLRRLQATIKSVDFHLVDEVERVRFEVANLPALPLTGDWQKALVKGLADSTARLTVDKLDLGRYAALLPPTAGVENLAGLVSANLDARGLDVAGQVAVVASLDLRQAQVALAGRPELAALAPLDAGLSARATLDFYRQGAIVESLVAHLADGREIARLEVDSLPPLLLAGDWSALLARSWPKTVLRARLDGLDLGRYAALLPPTAGVENLAGLVSANLEARGLDVAGQVAVVASLDLRQAQVTLAGRPELAALPPLAAGLSARATIELGRQELIVESLVAHLADGREIARLEVDSLPPLLLDGDWSTLLARSWPKTALRVRLDGLDLGRYAALLPPSAGVENLAGLVSANLDARGREAPDLLSVTGKLDLRRTQLALLDKPELKSVDFDLGFDLTYAADGMLTLATLTPKLAPAGQAGILDLHVAGAIDTAMQGRLTHLEIVSRQAIDAGALQALLIIPEATPSTAPPPADGTVAESATPPPALPTGLWVEIGLSAPEIRYRALAAKEVRLQATLKDGILRLPQTTLILDDGQANLAAEVDLRDLAKPTYRGEANFAKVRANPFLETFRPNWPVTLDGGLRQVAIKFAGGGDAPLAEALDASLACGIDNLRIVDMPAWANLLSSQLLRLLNLQPSDLAFEGGTAALSLANGQIKVEKTELNAALWRLAIDGAMPLGGQPDFTIVPAFRGVSAKRLADEGVPIGAETATDGFRAVPPLRLHGPIWDTLHASRLVLGYGHQLGKVGKDAKAVSDGVGILGDILRRPKEGETKDLEGTVDGVRNLIDSLRKK